MEKLSDAEIFVVAVNMKTTYRYRHYLWFRKENGVTYFAFPDGYKEIPPMLYQAILNLRNKGHYAKAWA